jgi:hypothetical protein
VRLDVEWVKITADMKAKLRFIEGSHRMGWSNTSGSEAAEEILQTSRMVQVLGGPEGYLDCLIERAIANQINRRRVSDGDPEFIAAYYAKELEKAEPQGKA